MSKIKSRIPAVLIIISSFLTIILIIFLNSKYRETSNSELIVSSPRPTFVPVTYNIPSPSPSPSPKNLKKETIHRENLDKTLAFYYTSDVPAFSHIEKGYEDDPFKLKLNGDTKYFSKGAAISGWNNHGGQILPDGYITIIKPKIIDLRTNSIRELLSIDKGMISGTGGKGIIGWADNNTLISRDCTEGWCEFSLIDTLIDQSSYYASFRSFSLSGYTGWRIIIHIKNYAFVQTRQGSTIDGEELIMGNVKIYADVPESVIKDQGVESYFSSHAPIQELKVSKNLNEFEFNSENIESFNQKIKIYLSSIPQYSTNSTKDGYFVLDLQSGTVIEESNL